MINSVELLNQFQEYNVRYTLYEHPPLKDAEAANAIRHKVKGLICKSLFLTDNSGAFWLVTVPLDSRVDLKKLAEQLGSRRLTFGDAQSMQELLGVMPGSVTPLAIINDTGHRVSLALDEALLKLEWINIHPLINTLSIDITPKEVIMFAEDYGHDPLFVKDIYTEPE